MAVRLLIRKKNGFMVNVFCVNTGTTMSFPEGTTLMDILPAFNVECRYPILAAKVNNVTQGLKYRVFNSRTVEFLDYTTYIGRSVYCNSLCFLLCKAARDVFPGCRVVLRRPISKGYFCTVTKEDQTVLSYSDLDRITARMKEIVDADMPFRRHEVTVEEAIRRLEGITCGKRGTSCPDQLAKVLKSLK